MEWQTFAFLLAILATTNGQLLFQDEVEALAKEVNLLADGKPREARQHQAEGYNYRRPSNPIPQPSSVQQQQHDGYEYPIATNPLPQPSRVDEQREEHHDHHHGEHSHIHVTRLDVTCDTSGMRVELEFDGAFNGIVYSKGHYKNRKCRYVSKDSARGDFNFLVPMDECGTVGEDRRDDHETILIIQNEEAVQEVWDSAKRVRCPAVAERKKITKTVSFNPFSVLRLDIDEPKQEKVEETKIECWMDIQVGDNPCGAPVKDRVKIGDQLSAVIYIKDGGANYDILVKDCFAHDNEDLKARNASSIQLSDTRGCPRKEKLMGLFKRTEQTCSSGADLIAFAPISAFKFADRPDVFLTCVVELCPGGCDQCQQASSSNVNVIQPPPFKCTPDLVGRDARCPAPTTQRTTTPFVCTPRLIGRDPRCPAPTTQRTTTTQFVCTPDLVGRDRRCPAPRTTTVFSCTPALVGRDPRCPAPTTPAPFVCTPQLVGRDARCPAPTTQRTTTQFVCTPELIGRDRRCPAPRTTTLFSCTPALVGRDPRCPAPTTPSTTTQFVCTPQLVGRDPRCPAPTTQRTTTQFSCTPDLVGRDPRCPAPRTTTVFSCTPALIGRDPRCPAPTTPAPPTTPRFVCTPELQGNDPRCPATGASFIRNPAKKGICEFNPTAPGCGLTQDGLEHHAFHKWQAATGKGTRRRPDGSRPTSAPHSRRRRDTSKNIVITGVGTGFHFK